MSRLGILFMRFLALWPLRAVRALGWLRRNTRRIQIAGGALLVVVGILLLTGAWNGLLVGLQTAVSGFTPAL